MPEEDRRGAFEPESAVIAKAEIWEVYRKVKGMYLQLERLMNRHGWLHGGDPMS